MYSATLGFLERLTWLAAHGVNIYQFLGEEHIDDARKFEKRKHPVSEPRRRGYKPRSSRQRVIRYKGPGFSKA